MSIIGTRPQIMKIDKDLPQKIIWTGQHWDECMKDVFFQELKMPKPDYELNSKSLGVMISKILAVLRKERPDLVLVYGDCRSTVAGAIAAEELGIPVGHVEAGVRCFNKSVPEERNRILVDHISKYHFVPDDKARENLAKEGIRDDVLVVGNVMLDTFGSMCPIKKKAYGTYSYVSIHRQENITSAVRMEELFETLEGMDEKFIFPCHPHTRKQLKKLKVRIPDNFETIEPAPYRKNLELISNARRVITDSGGVQNESTWMNVPCGVYRNHNEWEGWIELLKDEVDIKAFMDNHWRKEKKAYLPGAKANIRQLITWAI